MPPLPPTDSTGNPYFDGERERNAAIEDRVWKVVDALTGRTECPRGNFQSIERFVKALPLDALIDAALIANRQPFRGNQIRFRYFCGICWRMIRQTLGE